MSLVTAYTDGACSGNPGPGGIGILFIYKNRRKEISKGYYHTTNNRMELLAAIVAIESVRKTYEIELYTDSKYLCDSVNKGWLSKWIDNGWKKADKKSARNIDLWKRLAVLIKDRPVRFIWIKSHSGHPENELVDHLARQALKNPTESDTNYKHGTDALGMF